MFYPTGRHYSTPNNSCTPHPELPRRSNTCPSNDVSSYSFQNGHHPTAAAIQESSTVSNHVLVQPSMTELEHPILESSQEEQLYHVGEVSTSQSTFSSAPWSSRPSSRQQSQENFLSSGQQSQLSSGPQSQENFLESSNEVSGTFSTTSAPWYEQGTLKASRSSSQMYTQSPHSFRSHFPPSGRRTQSFRSVQSSLVQNQQRGRFSVDETAPTSRPGLAAGQNRPPPAIPYSQSYPAEINRGTSVQAAAASHHSQESSNTLCASLSPTHDTQGTHNGNVCACA